MMRLEIANVQLLVRKKKKMFQHRLKAISISEKKKRDKNCVNAQPSTLKSTILLSVSIRQASRPETSTILKKE